MSALPEAQASQWLSSVRALSPGPCPLYSHRPLPSPKAQEMSFGPSSREDQPAFDGGPSGSNLLDNHDHPATIFLLPYQWFIGARVAITFTIPCIWHMGE